jgi:hypothetical protein
MGYFAQESKLSKFYTENESKIKIIPCSHFSVSVIFRLKLLYAWVSNITKFRVIANCFIETGNNR